MSGNKRLSTTIDEHQNERSKQTDVIDMNNPSSTFDSHAFYKKMSQNRYNEEDPACPFVVYVFDKDPNKR